MSNRPINCFLLCLLVIRGSVTTGESSRSVCEVASNRLRFIWSTVLPTITERGRTRITSSQLAGFRGCGRSGQARHDEQDAWPTSREFHGRYDAHRSVARHVYSRSRGRRNASFASPSLGGCVPADVIRSISVIDDGIPIGLREFQSHFYQKND